MATSTSADAAVSATSTATDTTTTANVFDFGKYHTEQPKNVEPYCCLKKSTLPNPPPKPLLVAMPSEAGEYPLLVLLHGYLLRNSFYSQLIRHIASHGFIVVAPQLYCLTGLDASVDIKSAAETIKWLSGGGLLDVLPANVQPDLKKIGLAGHSRGGKAAFALALGKVETSALKLSALIGIDPVDGKKEGMQINPPVLTYSPHSFELGHMPVMVIGTGLGEVQSGILCACAPKGVNHEQFYKECQAPAFHFVAKDYGHLDMLDDETRGLLGTFTYCSCKNGKSREPMRRFVGGIVVAFMKAHLLGDDSDLMAVINGTETTPVDLTIEFDI
ncbi:chlorophyllase-2-like [Carya illinoinensis]|uniref:Chlorophyllase n=2 Tax=Carya illinoinensis TaxID=32201 RepID=A0A922A1Z0_CARIL|nr:chlorophyllase-2-like [Carya illinoinensis]KAG6619139.1 hypothetical protein I3842_Q108900 [Carya illinoinensis]KAG6732814.1 hypothetical protein I3842_01G195800 [Carya illinoinensis]